MLLKSCEIRIRIVKVKVADAVPLALCDTHSALWSIVYVLGRVPVAAEHVDEAGSLWKYWWF